MGVPSDHQVIAVPFFDYQENICQTCSVEKMLTVEGVSRRLKII